MTFAEFDREIKQIEQRLAYGSETSMYGHFVQRMDEVHDEVAPNDEWGWRESDVAVPAREVDWWCRAYDLYEAEQSRPDEQEIDVRDIFDRV